jgi:large-conductance mechanosensitive channel
MGRNEIRLRRKKMSSGRIARHRNYGDLMARHEQELKIRRITRIVIYFLLIAFLTIIFIIVVRWEERENMKKHEDPAPSSAIHWKSDSLQDDHL